MLPDEPRLIVSVQKSIRLDGTSSAHINMNCGLEHDHKRHNVCAMSTA
jgi:hypothetical protein